MTVPVRVGLVGAGYWARLNHAPLHASPGPTALVGVWARRPDAAASLAAEFAVPACSSLNELYDRCDAVAFAVPPTIQAEIGIEAARRGKGLILEKPIAGDLSQARDLVSAIHDSGVPSIVAFTRRFHATTQRFIEDSRDLTRQGRVWGCHGLFLHGGALPGGFLEATGTWRAEKTGPLMDLGVHLIDLVRAALGGVARVRVSGGPYTCIEMTHHSGATSQLAVSMDVATPASIHTVDVFADSGTAHFTTSGMDQSLCWSELRRQFANAYHEDSPVTVSADDAMNTQAVLDACVRSLTTGGAADVDASSPPTPAQEPGVLHR